MVREIRRGIVLTMVRNTLVFIFCMFGGCLAQSTGLISLQAPESFQVASSQVRDVSMLLTWNAVSKASFYKLYIKPPTPSASGIGQNIQTTYSFVNGLKPDTQYEFTLFAAHGQSLSNPSTVVHRTALPAPQNVAVVHDSLSHDSMTIRWSAVPGKAGYIVTIQPSLGVIGAGEGIYTEECALTGLSPNTQYTVTVAAMNWVGNGASTTIQQRTKLPPPQNLRVLPEMLSPQTIGVEWDEVTGASNYVVTYTPSIKLPQTVQDTFILISDLQPDTVYTVKVATRNAAGLSIPNSISRRTSSICSLSPNDFSERNFGLLCPSHCSRHQSIIYGTGEYTADSPICTAAIHDGRIDNNVEGYVMVKKKSGIQFFRGSTQHGITSETYRFPDDSFVFALQPPKNISIIGPVQHDKFVVQWSPVRGATMYRITIEPNQGNIITPDTKLPINNLKTNSTYTVYVVATSSDETSEAAKLTQTTALPSPKQLEVMKSSVHSTNFTLVWQHVVGADNYFISVYLSGKLVHKNTTKNNTISITNLFGGNSYNVSVYAVNQIGNGKPALLSQTTALSMPKGLSVAEVSSSTMKITWMEVHGATEYKLSVMPCCQSIHKIGEQMHWVKNLTSNTEYTIEVVARSNATSDSLPSVIKQRTALGAPRGIHLESGKLTHTNAVISWQTLEGATDYSATIFGETNQTIVVNKTEVLFQGLQSNSNYSVVVFGRNFVGHGENVNLQFTTLLLPPEGVWVEKIQNSSITLKVHWKEEIAQFPYFLDCRPSNNISGLGIHTRSPAFLSGFSAGQKYNVSLMAQGESQYSLNSTYVLDTSKPDIPLIVACMSTFSRLVVVWKTNKYQISRVNLLVDGSVSQSNVITYNTRKTSFTKPQSYAVQKLELQVYAHPESDTFVENILQSTLNIEEKYDNEVQYANVFWLSSHPKKEFEVVLSSAGATKPSVVNDASATFPLDRQKQYTVNVNTAGHITGISLDIPSFTDDAGNYPITTPPTDDQLLNTEPSDVEKNNPTGQTWIVIVVVVGILLTLLLIICVACACEMCRGKPLVRNHGCCECVCRRNEKL